MHVTQTLFEPRIVDTPKAALLKEAASRDHISAIANPAESEKRKKGECEEDECGKESVNKVVGGKDKRKELGGGKGSVYECEKVKEGECEKDDVGKGGFKKDVSGKDSVKEAKKVKEGECENDECWKGSLKEDVSGKDIESGKNIGKQSEKNIGKDNGGMD